MFKGKGDPPTRISEELMDGIDLFTVQRGQMAGDFAQMEFLLADFVIKCRRFPEYAVPTAQFPISFSARCRATAAIAEAIGPCRPWRSRLLRTLNRLRPFEEHRHFLAHGFVEAIVDNAGALHKVRFRRYKRMEDGQHHLVFWALTPRKYENLHDVLANETDDGLRLFREIYNELGLDD